VEYHAEDALKLFCNYYFNEFGGGILEDMVPSPSGRKFLHKIKGS